jgi:hypothetical protein
VTVFSVSSNRIHSSWVRSRPSGPQGVSYYRALLPVWHETQRWSHFPTCRTYGMFRFCPFTQTQKSQTEKEPHEVAVRTASSIARSFAAQVPDLFSIASRDAFDSALASCRYVGDSSHETRTKRHLRKNLREFLIADMLRYSKTGTFAYGVLLAFKNESDSEPLSLKSAQKS